MYRYLQSMLRLDTSSCVDCSASPPISAAGACVWLVVHVGLGWGALLNLIIVARVNPSFQIVPDDCEFMHFAMCNERNSPFFWDQQPLHWPFIGQWCGWWSLEYASSKTRQCLTSNYCMTWNVKLIASRLVKYDQWLCNNKLGSCFSIL